MFLIVLWGVWSSLSPNEGAEQITTRGDCETWGFAIGVATSWEVGRGLVPNNKLKN